MNIQKNDLVDWRHDEYIVEDVVADKATLKPAFDADVFMSKRSYSAAVSELLKTGVSTKEQRERFL